MPNTIENQITDNDLNRINSWFREKGEGCTLDAIVRRFLRGRIKYGEDLDGKVIPELREYKGSDEVLSWDQLEQWKIGSHVLVAKWDGSKIQPKFGVVTNIEENGMDESFVILIGDQAIRYAKYEPGCEQVKRIINCLRDSIYKEQQFQENKPHEVNLESKIDLIILNQGSALATRVRAALETDDRFLYHNQYWYLKEWITELSTAQIYTLHTELMNQKGHRADNSTIINMLNMNGIEFVSVIVDFSLSAEESLFQRIENGWLALKPPPPTWENAQGSYYVYDPESFQIILTPGEQLNPESAHKLESLGFYGDVVTRLDNFAI